MLSKVYVSSIIPGNELALCKKLTSTTVVTIIIIRHCNDTIVYNGETLYSIRLVMIKLRGLKTFLK